jgi:hypothetical protein
VVLDVDREMPLAAPQRDALGHGPARERSVPLEPEVVVEPARGVALDHEAWQLGAGRTLAERLGRLARTPLAPVLVERHVAVDCRPKRNTFFTNRLQIG